MGSTSIPPSLWSNDIHHSPSITSNIQLPTFKVQMDNESVRSGHSDRSRRSRPGGGGGGSGGQHNHNSSSHNVSHSSSNHVMGNNVGNYNTYHHPTSNNNNRINNHHHGHHQNHNNSNHHPSGHSSSSTHHRANSRHSHRSTKNDRSFVTKMDSPYETTTMTSSRHERRRDEELIEVQILPQDDNWADNTTAITGNTSDHSISIEADINKLGKDPFWSEQSLAFKCQMWSGTVVAAFLSFCAFVSPIVMVTLPRIESLDWKVQECGPECDGLLISFSFKLLILVLGSWALFFRKPRATMPRIFIYRSVVLALVFVFMVSYWLFYSVRIAERRFSEYELSYHSIVLFAVSLVDALLFIHYLAVILIELRHMQPQYFIKVVRSPDGESHSYNIGELSIQRAAVWILENYYKDFSIYNPYLDTIPRRRSSKSNGGSVIGNSIMGNHISSPPNTLKYYDVDGVPPGSNFGNSILGQHHHHQTSTLSEVHMNGGLVENGRPSFDSSANNIDQSGNTMERTSRRGRSSSHHRHHHFHDDHEHEKKIKKRKQRLLTAVDEAFTHIKRIDEEAGPAIPMDPYEAAQAIFPSMARSLQKYLRATRQQPRHSMQSILKHLSLCLSYDLSPKAFLEKYLVASPVLQNEKEQNQVQTWGLICDILLSRTIEDGTVFMLRQGDVSLLVTVHNLPHLNLTEEIIDPKCNKFVFRMNSETSV